MAVGIMHGFPMGYRLYIIRYSPVRIMIYRFMCYDRQKPYNDVCTQVHKALYGGLEDSDGVTLLGILSHPVSRGTVRLASSNPKDPPIIDANYLASDDDVSISAEGELTGRILAGTSRDFQIRSR